MEVAIASSDIKKSTGAAEALHQISESIHKRSLVVIFSDMFDNLSDAY